MMATLPVFHCSRCGERVCPNRLEKWYFCVRCDRRYSSVEMRRDDVLFIDPENLMPNGEEIPE